MKFLRGLVKKVNADHQEMIFTQDMTGRATSSNYKAAVHRDLFSNTSVDLYVDEIFEVESPSSFDPHAR